MTDTVEVTQVELLEYAERSGMKIPPTPTTIDYRKAVDGFGGPHERDWVDKPRRLVIGLCREVEAQDEAKREYRKRVEHTIRQLGESAAQAAKQYAADKAELVGVLKRARFQLVAHLLDEMEAPAAEKAVAYIDRALAKHTHRRM